MGSSHNRVCFMHRNRHSFIIPILLVLVLSSFTFMVQATRPIPTKLPESSTGGKGKVLEEENAGGGERVNARQIGSRPPQCRRRCGGCVHCVAVQVPVAPVVQHRQQQFSKSSASSSSTKQTSPKSVAYSRGGDGLSNYKPISWKCKCGDLLFNP